MNLNAVIFLVIIFSVRGKVEKINCEKKTNCAQCIQTKGCAWCSKVLPNIYEQRSQFSKCHPSDRIMEICENGFVDNQKTTLKVTANQPMKNGPDGNTVQIRPQEVFLKLKPGDDFTLDVDFRKAENYPVDLYYLMDFSSSMSKHKNNLSKLGRKLAETMKNLTTDFQLGFGSFVDKVTLPFTSVLSSHLLRPCPNCRSPYSFKNHMPLTRLTEQFPIEVSKAQMSGNIDTPEGVLDALMQVIVCRGPLNWREKARHIVVVSTDAPFHLAGDGKLGGVMEPHDGSCYLNEEGDYTHSLDFDYPSVSQINHKALDNNINVIFAVVNKMKNEYSSLSNEIRGSSWGLLDAKENIADLIKAQYEKITTTIRLTDNARGPVRVTYSALCNKGEKWKNSNECTNIKEGSFAFFKIHISISECTNEKFNRQKITVKPIGMNETLTINLEAICDCECAKDYQASEKAAEYCSFAGDLICGLCACYENRIGKNCECRGDNENILNITDTKECISNNVTNEICSGHGECKCGLCQCYPRQNPKEKRTGKFCECDNFSCEKSNGLPCSGHGTCKCGTCSCDPQWTGRTCDCSTDDSQCRLNSEDEPCSRNGECICGVCHCRNKTGTEEHRYAGKYCQICMTCLPQCHLYNDCVECLSYGSGPHAGARCSSCRKIFHHNLAESLEEVQKNYSGNLCVSADHLGCTFKYFYYYQENDQLVVWSEKNTVCPKAVNTYAVVAGTIGSTVLIGLLSLIIWKVIVEVHDKKEYEKFEKERNLAKWGRGENPLFKTATTTYANPTYTTDCNQ